MPCRFRWTTPSSDTPSDCTGTCEMCLLKPYFFILGLERGLSSQSCDLAFYQSGEERGDAAQSVGSIRAHCGLRKQRYDGITSPWLRQTFMVTFHAALQTVLTWSHPRSSCCCKRSSTSSCLPGSSPPHAPKTLCWMRLQLTVLPQETRGRTCDVRV